MPASGTTVYSRLAYNATKWCGSIEPYAMQEWAQYQYSLLVGSNATISQFKRRIVVMPNNNCNAYGFGSQGCQGSYCYQWIRGDRASDLNTFFHELGHSLNAQHSSSCVWEYGDCSCPMGCSSDRGCFNAPTSLRVGWSTSLATHNENNTAIGSWYSYTIPAMEVSDTNQVVIYPTWQTPSWSGSGVPAYYLSMKINTGYDQTILSTYTSK